MMASVRQSALRALLLMMGAVLVSAPAHAAELAHGRGYELVSPPSKSGGDVMAHAARTRASASGDAVNFASLTAFGDVLGTGIATEYVGQRTAQPGTRGWDVHGIIPPVEPLSLRGTASAKDTLYQGEFSEDLSKGVLHSYSPLGDDPNVARVSNLYLRQDVLALGSGTYSLLSACPACASELSDPFGVYLPMVAGATPDLGHVIFEAGRNLTADAPDYPPFPSSLCNDNPIAPFLNCLQRLYEWDHGVLRLAGILPNGSAAPISIAGLGASVRRYTLNTISRDGSKIFFTVPPSSGNISGDLYMRVDHTSTIQLNASKRTDCADANPCSGVPEPDPAGSQPATYASASADGSKVFFTTSEQLVDAPGGDLYVYDTTLPGSNPDQLRHVFTDQQPHDGGTGITGVLGTNRDGSYIYFLDQSALLPGQDDLPIGASDGIYVWHNGTVNFVGSVNAGETNTIDRGWDGSMLGSRVTPDGRTLLFTARIGRGLTGYAHGAGCGSFGNESCLELYRYRADTASLSCVSCGAPGTTASADATFGARVGIGGSQSTSHLNHPITDDGTKVFFETGERLLPGQDINGKKTDVYEWTAIGSSGCGASTTGYSAASKGCLSLVTTGNSTDDSHFLDADPSGRDIFFSTNQRLNGWDTDNNYDLYDARIGGGFPEPPAAEVECRGEVCQGSVGGPPATSSLASKVFFDGRRDVAAKKKAAKKCPKGKVRKRVHGKLKCVKSPRKKNSGRRG